MEIKTLYMDCADIYDRETAHDCLSRSLELPEYYGRNLDALYDCLTEMPPCRIVLKNVSSLRAIGDYGYAILEVLSDAAGDRADFVIYE